MTRVALVPLFGLALGCSYRYPDPMSKQEKAQAYRPSELFEDGRAMRPPVPGTVPRERKRGSPEVLTGRRGGVPVDRIPIAISRSLLEEGRRDFEAYCGACHGLLGDGNTVVARSMALRPPPSLIDEELSPGFVYVAMTEGYGLMPSYVTKLSVDARWGVVAYLEALRRSQRQPIDVAPDEVRSALRDEPP